MPIASGLSSPPARSLIPAGCPRFEDDFSYDPVQGAQGFGRWVFTNNNGSGATIASTSAQEGVERLRINAGAAAGRAALSRALGNFKLPTAAFWQFNLGFILPQLSVAGDRFTVRAGLMDADTAAPSNGVWFEYTDNVNQGQWVVHTMVGGVDAPFNTGIVVTTNKFALRAYSLDGVTVVFSINGTIVFSTSAALPTVALGEVVGIFNSSSTAIHDLNVDYGALYPNTGRASI